MPRVLLFDWMCGGHHELYVRRFAEALDGVVDVVAAVPGVAIERLDGIPAGLIDLGAPRPAIDDSRHLSTAKRRVGQSEVAILERAVSHARASGAVHLFADGAIRWLAGRETHGVPLAAVVFRPRAHYPRHLDSHLTARERAVGAAVELGVRRWRRTRGAWCLLTLDEVAARRWARRPGAPVHWLPEPPVAATAGETETVPGRRGVALVGALAARKGLEWLADALSVPGRGTDVVLAGSVEPRDRDMLERCVARMRSAGAVVDVRDRWHREEECLAVLCAASCAVLPYPRHVGMSRVLLEAAAVGTPVVVHDWGLLGHLVRRYEIGLAVDAGDPQALRGAIESLTRDPEARERYRDALERFHRRYAAAAFRDALVGALAATPSKLLPSTRR